MYDTWVGFTYYFSYIKLCGIRVPDITTYLRKVNHVPSSYNILLWIRTRCTCWQDDPEKILEWIDEKITCHMLTRSDIEVRVNDYNPLILMLWKANMDI